MPETQHDFERALDFLKGGYKVRRTHWEPGSFMWMTNQNDTWRLVDHNDNDLSLDVEAILAEDWEIIPLDWVPPE